LYRAQSIDRAATLLLLVGRAGPQGARLTDLVAQTDLPRGYSISWTSCGRVRPRREGKRRSPTIAIDRMLRAATLLLLVGRAGPQGARLTDLVAQTDLAKPTVHRMLLGRGLDRLPGRNPAGIFHIVDLLRPGAAASRREKALREREANGPLGLPRP
jgi:hypothetical protein